MQSIYSKLNFGTDGRFVTYGLHPCYQMTKTHLRHFFTRFVNYFEIWICIGMFVSGMFDAAISGKENKYGMGKNVFVQEFGIMCIWFV